MTSNEQNELYTSLPTKENPEKETDIENDIYLTRLILSITESFNVIDQKLLIKKRRYSIDEYIYYLIMMELADMDILLQKQLRDMIGDNDV